MLHQDEVKLLAPPRERGDDLEATICVEELCPTSGERLHPDTAAAPLERETLDGSEQV